MSSFQTVTWRLWVLTCDGEKGSPLMGERLGVQASYLSRQLMGVVGMVSSSGRRSTFGVSGAIDSDPSRDVRSSVLLLWSV